MTVSRKKTSPTWTDVKAKLAEFDRVGLLGVVQDLYAASKDNQAFLHARFGLGEDALGPYKATIHRWLWPDVVKNQSPSVSAAKRAIAEYKKASGQPEGLAGLMVFYCECAAGFGRDYGVADGGYFDALVRMFEQALKASDDLETDQRDTMLNRLDTVRRISRNFGYGVDYAMDGLLARYGGDRRAGFRTIIPNGPTKQWPA